MTNFILEHHPLPAWTYSVTSGRIIQANAAAAREYGFTQDELHGLDLRELRPEEDVPAFERRLEALAARPAEVSHSASRHRRRDGSVVWVEVSAGPAGSASSDVRVALVQPGRMAVLGRLIGSLAHDFKHLLTMIGASAELIGLQREDEYATGRSIGEIMLATERAQELTERLGDVITGALRVPVEVDLTEAVSSMEPLLQRLLGDQATLRVELPDEPAPVLGDRLALEQVVWNLLANSRDAGARQVRVTVRSDDAREQVVLEVADDGAGMPADVLARARQAFFSTKPQGSGLGLATVGWVADQLGAALELDSTPGEGTVARLRLRARDRPARILLVEDEPRLRAVLAAGLEHHGFVVYASDAATGAAALAEAAQAGGPVDLLVTDVRLAHDSGADVAGALGARQPGVPTLYVSGAGEEELVERLPPGARILRKPFPLAGLLAQVRELLAERG